MSGGVATWARPPRLSGPPRDPVRRRRVMLDRAPRSSDHHRHGFNIRLGPCACGSLPSSLRVLRVRLG
eukprot:9988687-Lingulodinium_polyedra.AAC.1